MKHTKLIIAGLTAAITLSGAAAVFADETKSVEPEEMRRGSFQDMEIDMSGLDLPEDFVPFDEAHVPDGINVPVNGELKPIEFDEEGNMLFGQRPEEGMPPMMNGERPELPEFADGERPELPEGEMPQMNGGMPGFQQDGFGQPGEQNPGMNSGIDPEMTGNDLFMQPN